MDTELRILRRWTKCGQIEVLQYRYTRENPNIPPMEWLDVPKVEGERSSKHTSN